MKLSKVYSNTPGVFPPLEFRDGVNVILGSIRRPENRQRDTHNLGKTLLAQVIDFGLLRGKTADFFLFKHKQFAGFVFLLEIRLRDSDYLTIRRSVADGSKASFIRHVGAHEDHTMTPDAQWLHWNQPFDRSREILDAALDLTAVRPWAYRHAVAYALRTQRDYDEPFRLAKFAGAHSDWKPFLAHLLGLDAALVQRGYEVDDALAEMQAKETQLRSESVGAESPDQLRGVVDIAERETAALTRELDAFDLGPVDSRVTKELVEDIDGDLAQANELRYALLTDRQRIVTALEQRIGLDVESLARVFEQAQVYFGDQVRKDYAALERFNRELVDERDGYLRAEIGRIDGEIAETSVLLDVLNVRRTSALKAISDAQALSAYKRLGKRLSTKQAELEGLARRLQSVDALQVVRRQLRDHEVRKAQLQLELEESVSVGSEQYAGIRRVFDEIVFRVLGRHGNLYSRVNAQGHIEFHAEILDDEGRPTSAGDGFSYGRLLCIAFDMALLRAYAGKNYVHFVYHDGVLESLDDRKKLNLIELIREYAASGTQHIVTVIDSELPETVKGERFSFELDEVVLQLHDADDSGRLFHMPEW